MTITINHSTPADGTFSAAGAIAWDANHSFTGVLDIVNGGTGQTTQTAGFDALAPTTTKGDLIVSNGTNNVRLPVGTDTYSLVADSTQATGVKWSAGGGGGGASGFEQTFLLMGA